MPVCPTGYTLTSFRPCPISHSSLGTAKMPKLSKKAKLKKNPKNPGILKTSGFLLISILECGSSFPSKFANRNQQEEKPHGWIKCWALCKIKIVSSWWPPGDAWSGVSPWCPSLHLILLFWSQQERAAPARPRVGSVGWVGAHQTSPGMSDVALRLNSPPGAKKARGR